MTCDLHREKLAAYADESLSPEDLSGVEDHLRACPSCAAEVLTLIQMKRATRAAAASLTLQPEFRMNPDFRRKLEKSIQSSRRPRWKSSWLPGLATATAALLLVVASIVVLTGRAGRNQAIAESLDLHVATLASHEPERKNRLHHRSQLRHWRRHHSLAFAAQGRACCWPRGAPAQNWPKWPRWPWSAARPAVHSIDLDVRNYRAVQDAIDNLPPSGRRSTSWSTTPASAADSTSSTPAKLKTGTR
jgi:hypothetical protein